MTLAANGQPDWADLLAKAWVDQIREIFRNKGYDGSPSKPIVTTTATTLMKPIDNIFNQGIDYEAPDYVLREVLKRNIWDFSVAKNHQDNIRINNLLLDDDGKLRGWSDFKYEARKVVGESDRYLKTEYNTVVAAAQMSRLWMEIQRDKALFPFAQFDVVEDGRTSDICKSLAGVIVSVDDPMLAYYFPPNHFNCRTTVRKLRIGTPTEKYAPPDIPEAFQNNVAETGKIFTDKNAYIEKTPVEVGEILFRELRKEKRAEIQEWSKDNIKSGGDIINGFMVTRRSIREMEGHITDIELKNIIKDIRHILNNLELMSSKPLSKEAPNYEKKKARGVIGYEYYKFIWKNQTLRMNVEVYKNGEKKPYSYNLIKE